MQKFDLLGDHGYLCTKVMGEVFADIFSFMQKKHMLKLVRFQQFTLGNLGGKSFPFYRSHNRRTQICFQAH